MFSLDVASFSIFLYKKMALGLMFGRNSSEIFDLIWNESVIERDELNLFFRLWVVSFG